MNERGLRGLDRDRRQTRDDLSRETPRHFVDDVNLQRRDRRASRDQAVFAAELFDLARGRACAIRPEK
jgi:hypothetical protein